MFKLTTKCIKKFLKQKNLKLGYENTRNLSSEKKRFYKSVSVTQSNGIFEINLDRHKLKTPMGKVFQVPSEPLALAVATEWDAQQSLIQQNTMHLTSLSNSVIDNLSRRTSESLAESIINFLDTDTVCYRLNEPPELKQLQEEQWNPVLDWCNHRYNVAIPCTTGIAIPVIPTEIKDTFRRHLLSYNFWALTGFYFGVESVKSLVLTLAAVDRFISVEKAVSLSRLEQEFQTSTWGTVEWSHDLELMDTRARLSAAVLFIYNNSNTSDLKQRSVRT
jgi:ATP synthase F1 complex assembly factor 2